MVAPGAFTTGVGDMQKVESTAASEDFPVRLR